jgi:hypothetical protein
LTLYWLSFDTVLARYSPKSASEFVAVVGSSRVLGRFSFLPRPPAPPLRASADNNVQGSLYIYVTLNINDG